MQNTFGFKDFVLLVLVMVVGALVALAMIQDDRRWEETQKVRSTLSDLEQSIGRLERDLRRIGGAGGGLDEATLERLIGSLGGVGGAAEPLRPSWARDEGEVVWQGEPEFVNDPADDPDFRVGGEFIEIFEAQMPKVMPYLAQDVYARRITDIVFEKLATYDPVTLEPKGVLAEAWQMDPAGLWLRVKIRDEARFSDGHPVLAEDVVFTWEDFILNPQLETERARSIATSIENVEVIEDRVVEFTFNEALFNNLSNTLTADILPKHFFERFTSSQINEATSLILGSGMYRLETVDPDNQWSPATDLVLVRNESHWGRQQPALEQLRYRVITEFVASLTAYRNGEADMMRPTSDQFVRMQEENEDWDESNYSLNWVNMRSGYAFIAWQAGLRNGETETPFADQRVRLAMTHLLDRRRIIDDILQGIGEIATGTYNSASPFYNPDIEPWPHDLDRARELLAEAGWVDEDGDGVLEKDGEEFSFEFTYSIGSETTRRIAKYLGDQCAAVGIRMSENPIDWSIFADTLSTRNFDAITFAWSANAPESDPRQIWHSESILNQGDNFIQWSTPEMDETIDSIRTTLDLDARTRAWHEFHRIVHEEQPYTFLVARPWLRFVSKDFANVNMYPKGIEKSEWYATPAAGF